MSIKKTLVYRHIQLNLRFFLTRQESAGSLILVVALYASWLLLLVHPADNSPRLQQLQATLVAVGLHSSNLGRILPLLCYFLIQAVVQGTLRQPMTAIAPLLWHHPVTKSELRASWLWYLQLKTLAVNLLCLPLLIIGLGFARALGLACVVQVLVLGLASLHKPSKPVVPRSFRRSPPKRSPTWSPLAYRLRLLRLLCGSFKLLYLYVVAVGGVLAFATAGAGSTSGALLVLVDFIFMLATCSGSEQGRFWELARHFRALPLRYSTWQAKLSAAGFWFTLLPRGIACIALLVTGTAPWLVLVGFFANTLLLPLLFAPSFRFSLVYLGLLAASQYLIAGQLRGSLAFSLILLWPVLAVAGVWSGHRDFYTVPFDKSRKNEMGKTYDPM